MGFSVAIEGPREREHQLRQLLDDAAFVSGARTPDCVILVHDPPQPDVVRRLARRGVPVVVVAPDRLDASLCSEVLRAGAMEVVQGWTREGVLAAIGHALDRAAFLEQRPAAGRVIDQVFAFVGLLDRTGTMLDANEAPLMAAGIPLEEVVGKKFWETFWWSYDEQVQQRVRVACERAAGGEVVRYDTAVRTAGDHRMAIDFQLAPLRDARGRVTHLVPSAVDITEREQAQQRLAFHVENSPLAVVEWGPDFRCWRWSGQAERIFGYRATEVLGRHPSEWRFVHEEDQAVVDEVMARLISGLDRRNFSRNRNYRRDGSIGWYEWYNSVLFDEEGRLVSILSLVLDVSEQRTAEAALVEREGLLRAVTESVADPIYAKDRQGRLLLANPATLRVIGATAEEALGSTELEFIDDPERARAIMANDQRVMRSGRTEAVEERVPTSGGERLFLSMKSPLRDADGEVVGLVGVSRDITDQRRSEQALREADRRKDDFISVLAHELRNPLGPVRHSVQILRRAGPETPLLQRALDTLERQVAHMVRLIDDLLDVSRIARGKLALKRQPCDLAAIAHETAEDYRSGLQTAGLGLTLSGGEGPVWVEGDPVRLAQMIGNLLHNAGRFTPRGGRVTVDVGRDPRTGCGTVSVSDTGRGIEQALLERLFDPFSQADQGPARSKGGLGLGLALTRGLAELHGGRIEVHSDGPDRGAVFRVLIPLAETRAGAAATAHPASPVDRLRILVVEDNEDAAHTLGDLLELSGHDVRLAFDGVSGVQAARTFDPQVVISDLGLPGALDGYGVARALRDDPTLEHVLLIALSGYADEPARRRAREAGFDVHLAKPADLPVLERALARVSDRSGSGVEGAEVP